MLSIKTTQRLKQLGIQAATVQDFASGIKLLQLVCHAYYKGDNPALSSKIKWSDDQKTGNKVVNINIILNYIKKDQNIQLPPSIRQLSAFKLMEQDESMIMLIDHLLSQLPKIQGAVNNELSPPRQQQNQFDNLYFVASLQKKNLSEDSLQAQNPADKVVRKGSFKVLKPKVSSDSKFNLSVNNDHQAKSLKQQRMIISESKQPLKQVFSLHQTNRPSSSLQELNPRKTIPKALERPPLYRHHRQSQEGLRQKHQSLKQSRKQTPNISASQTDRQTIIKNIQSINNQIAQEEKSINLINSSINYSKPEPIKGKSSRKIFKIDIQDIGQVRKRVLVQWLIGINILSLNASKFTFQLHKICKDGVIFMQIVNYYRGRGRNICFFKEPKRSAEMHSNYQKLFSSLQDMVQFRSQLLHQYQYFIPQIQPNAFWSMLSSIHSCFCKEVKHKNEGIVRYQNSVSKTMERASSRRKKMSEQVSYQDVKFNSSSVSKDTKQVKSNFSSVQIPRKETPKPQSKLKSQETSHKEAPYGLVQHEQPVQENLRTERGYKEMYLSKFKNVETPYKNRSFTNSSLSKSRLRSIGSAKKHQIKPIQPSVSLQMQMVVLKYLSSLSIAQEQQLFRDPYRNGILVCQIIKKQWGVESFASKKPKNIDDCRNNFLSAIQAIKSRRKGLQVSYEYFVQDLVKGQKTLLYGLIWNVLKENEQSKQPFNSIQIEDKPIHKNRQNEEQKISWVRSIQKNCPQIALMKIRTEQALYNMITSSDFLFHYACFITAKKAITPNYQRPFNKVQKQSNLKKALSYLIQNKIIRSDYLWKCKSLLSKQATTLQDLVNDLISHFNRLYQKEQIRTVNFVRYIRREQSQEKQKPHEKLQTTMANQTITNQTPLIQPHPLLQINWMRKLGFKGSLQLHNGVILCRLVAKLGMKTIQGVNQNPQSRAQCLGNIRRAIKQLPKFKWDQYDIAQSDYNRCLQVYAFLRDHFKHSYALKSIL